MYSTTVTENNHILHAPSDEEDTLPTNARININSTPNMVGLGVEMTSEQIPQMQPLSQRSIWLQRSGRSESGNLLASPSDSEKRQHSNVIASDSDLKEKQMSKYSLTNSATGDERTTTLYQRYDYNQAHGQPRVSPTTQLPVFCQDTDDLSSVNRAVFSGNHMWLKALLRKGLNPNGDRTNQYERSTLKVAIEYRDKLIASKIAIMLIKAGVDPGYKLTGNQSMLYAAVRTDQRPVIKELLKRGVDVNAGMVVTVHNNPLHCAIMHQNFKCIDLLLSYKADINCVSNNKTPLQLALNCKSAEIAAHMVISGASVLGTDEANYCSLLSKKQFCDSRFNPFKLKTICLRKIFYLCDRPELDQDTIIENIKQIPLPSKLKDTLADGLWSSHIYK